MKFEPHLPQLPSLGELLEHPRVKGVVTRINRSTLAQRAAGFLDELRSSLVERAGKIEVPPVGQLAERLARRLLGEPVSAGPIINATGVVIGDRQLIPPLADVAIHAMAQVASEYHMSDGRLSAACSELLCELTQAECAIVVGSFEAAASLILSSAAANREFIVWGDVTKSEIDWPRMAARTAAVFQQCGGSAEEVAQACSSRSNVAAIVRVAALDAVQLKNFAAVADRGCLIDVAALAGLLNPSSYHFESVDTLTERVQSGADVIIADGAGLLGGPSCGIVLGKNSFIGAAAQHLLAPLVTASMTTLAALHATLLAYKNDKESVPFTIPAWQLLSAPPANGKQRAERLAPLIGAIPGIASAGAREIQSPWRAQGGNDSHASSSIIDVRPSKIDCALLARRLEEEAHPVKSVLADGAVRFNLRSVFPRWDQQLVSAVEKALTAD